MITTTAHTINGRTVLDARIPVIDAATLDALVTDPDVSETREALRYRAIALARTRVGVLDDIDTTVIPDTLAGRATHDLRALVADGLRARGAHALVNPDASCGCTLRDLMPCGCPSPACKAACEITCHVCHATGYYPLDAKHSVCCVCEAPLVSKEDDA